MSNEEKVETELNGVASDEGFAYPPTTPLFSASENQAVKQSAFYSASSFNPFVPTPQTQSEIPVASQTPAPQSYAGLLFMAPEITEFRAKPASTYSEGVREDSPRKQRLRKRTQAPLVELPEDEEETFTATEDDYEEGGVARRRRRRRSRFEEPEEFNEEVAGVSGSTRLEAKRVRRKESRKEGRRRTIVTESEFLARRESVKREMIVREQHGLNQIAVLEDGLLVEHYVARRTQQTMVGNIYLGRVQNVLPSMEAAFVDLGKGRNAVLYAGEVNWDAVGLGGRPRRIEQALKSGDTVLVQVTKDPIGHKGARLTSQITLAGRYLVLVPAGQMTGISRKLPERERTRLKKLLAKIVPKNYGVIVRTAAEGATEEQLRDDVTRLQAQWEDIEKKQKKTQKAPYLLRSEPELAVRVVRDVFTEDFQTLTVQGEETWNTVQEYVDELAPDLRDRVKRWVGKEDVFTVHRIDEQLTKGMDRKVWLPSGGSLVIDRTEAMTVIDVNTGKFIGSGGTLEETVTKNNLEAAEEIVRQLRLRDIGGIVVIDFVDMVLESNRDLVLRRLVECLGRDRTRHQVTEITSLGLVQMTRKRVGEGLVEAFSTPCECCDGRGFIVHQDPVERDHAGEPILTKSKYVPDPVVDPEAEAKHEEVRSALSAIAAAAANAHAAEKAEKKVEAEKADSSEIEQDYQRLKDSKGERHRHGFKERRRGERNRLLDDAEALLDSIDNVLAEKTEKAALATENVISGENAGESKPKRRSGRRTAVMAAGQPTVQTDSVEVAAVAIARPVAEVSVAAVSERSAKKARRVAISHPVDTAGNN